jgi:DNA-directed RNA polymerase III subunit RPC1
MLARKSFDGRPLGYFDRSDAAIDQHESARDFIQSIKDFVGTKARKLADARRRAGLFSFKYDPRGTEYEDVDLDEDGKCAVNPKVEFRR